MDAEVPMLEGSCLCGAVRYRARGPLVQMARCHCRECRKASGAEFATNGTVEAAGFELLQGHDTLREHESSPGNFRVFCGACGSPLYKRWADNPQRIRLRLGCLDSEVDERPLARVFVSEKPDWSEISDALPQFATRP
jgi:hypothetical protein